MVVTGLEGSTSVWGAGAAAELAADELGLTVTEGAGLTINITVHQYAVVSRINVWTPDRKISSDLATAKSQFNQIKLQYNTPLVSPVKKIIWQ